MQFRNVLLLVVMGCIGSMPAAARAYQVPAKTDPAKVEPTKVEPAKAEPAKVEPAKVEPAKVDAPKTEPAKTEPATPAPNAQAAAAEFEKQFTSWKKLLAELRTLQIDYQKATADADKAKIEAAYNTLIATGEKMQGQVQAAAEAAYSADPLHHPNAQSFLAAQASDLFKSEHYESAARVAFVLLKAGYKNPAISRIAGVSSFNIGDLTNAETYLREAADAGVLQAQEHDLLSRLPLFTESWKAEQAIREAEAKANDLPRVVLKTSKGEIEIELFENEAPNAVANFVSLIEKKFYDGLTFHRVISKFVAQGGDPAGTGSGGPGYSIACETEAPNARKHFRGSLSMAHAGKDTGGSQFFLTFVPTYNLDGRHTVFGRVIRGLDVLADLQRIDPDQPNPRIKPDKIVEAKVVRKRPHEYVVKKFREDPVAPPKTDPAKVDPPKTTEPPKTDAPKKEEPKAEAPKADAPKTETKKDEPKKQAS